MIATASRIHKGVTTEKESETLSLRLSKADKAMLDELVEAKRQELAPLGATTSLAQYVRGWIRSTHAAMVAKRNQRSTYEPAATPPARTTPAPSPKSAVAAPTEAEVRRKLKASKLSQAELGRLTGIDAAMLSRFRSGKKPHDGRLIEWWFEQTPNRRPLFFTAAEAATKALQFPPDRLSPSLLSEVGIALEKLGFERKRTSVLGRQVRGFAPTEELKNIPRRGHAALQEVTDDRLADQNPAQV